MNFPFVVLFIVVVVVVGHLVVVIVVVDPTNLTFKVWLKSGQEQ